MRTWSSTWSGVSSVVDIVDPRWSDPGDVTLELAIECGTSLAPLRADLVLVEPAPVRWREHRRITLDDEQHYCRGRGRRRRAAIHATDALVVHGASCFMERGRTGEAITAARELIHHVELEPGRVLEICACLWRGDVEEEQALVVPHADRALGGEVRTSVGRHRRGEAELTDFEHRAHVGSEDHDATTVARGNRVPRDRAH